MIGKKCMSSAEWFALMIKNAPNTTLIGDVTRGASASPREYELDNGVGLGVSSWVAYTEKMEIIEDRGIEPDIRIDPEQSYDAERDYVLEKAIEVIRESKGSPDCLVFKDDLSIALPCMEISGTCWQIFFQYTGEGFTWEVADFRSTSSGSCIPLNNDLSFTIPCIQLEEFILELSFEYTGSGLVWALVF